MKQAKETKAFSRILVTIALLLLLAACNVPPSEKPFPSGSFDPAKKIEPLSFKSLQEYKGFAKKYQTPFYGGGILNVFAMSTMKSAAIAKTSVESPQAVPVMQDESRDYSKTNVQVESVDEADIVKTDGSYIYTVTDKNLYLIKAYPGEGAEIVSTIKFKSRPSGLFIDGNYLAVFGNFENAEALKKLGISVTRGMTFFNIYSINDKEEPKLVNEYRFEGRYFQARMYNGFVYFVVTSQPEARLLHPTPIIVEGTKTRAIPVQDIYYFPIQYQNPQLATIHSIKIAEPGKEIVSKSIAVESSQSMYMSEKNIYITYTEYINEWEIRKKVTMDIMVSKLSEEDKKLVEKISNADNEILSEFEKEQKILQIIETHISYLEPEEQEILRGQIEKEAKAIMEQYEYLEYTMLHKIGVENGNIMINATGKVPGRIISQFAMDEKDNVLRIATTISPSWSSFRAEAKESTNNVYALDGSLNMIGSLKGLAEGEQIYSTRFIGDRLYMVTFRQADPFFVIDLGNPTSIKEIGKLKIPGFSRYLHPYDKDTIIGIGRDATEEGRTKGIKISLFDVSDVENPKEIAKYVSEDRYSQTVAEWEHKAFLFSKEKNLLVIPAYNYEYSDESKSYNGAMVFAITKEKIKLRGLIDHSFGRQSLYGPYVERSLYIEELLYTKSPSLLRINRIDDLGKVKNIELGDSQEGPIPVY